MCFLRVKRQPSKEWLYRAKWYSVVRYWYRYLMGQVGDLVATLDQPLGSLPVGHGGHLLGHGLTETQQLVIWNIRNFRLKSTTRESRSFTCKTFKILGTFDWKALAENPGLLHVRRHQDLDPQTFFYFFYYIDWFCFLHYPSKLFENFHWRNNIFFKWTSRMWPSANPLEKKV